MLVWDLIGGDFSVRGCAIRGFAVDIPTSAFYPTFESCGGEG